MSNWRAVRIACGFTDHLGRFPSEVWMRNGLPAPDIHNCHRYYEGIRGTRRACELLGRRVRDGHMIKDDEGYYYYKGKRWEYDVRSLATRLIYDEAVDTLRIIGTSIS